jgi:ATP-dependent DNA helicase DinG
VSANKAALDRPDILRLVNPVLDAHKDDDTFLAERDDFDGIDARDFSNLTTSADDCPGKKKCPFGDTCFAERAKAFAKEADIVVVNHALLLTHLRIYKATDGLVRLLGDFDTVIFDEAHEIEEYATSAWQIDLRERSIINFVADVKNWAEKVGTKENANAKRLADSTGPATSAIQKLWQVLPEGRLLLSDIATIGNSIIDVYEALVNVSTLIRDTNLDSVPEADRKARKGNQEKLEKRAGNLIAALSGLIARPEDFNDLVRWVDTEALGRRGVTNKVLHSAPVNVAPLLRESLFGQGRTCFACDGEGYGCKSCLGSGHEQDITCILVSATLSVARKFEYVAGRLGVDAYDGLDVGTPFDYQLQSRLYIPSHLPEPTQANREAHASLAINEIKELVKASDGRALLLFTSNSAMKRAYDALSGEIEHTCLVQGSDSNKVLAAKFMEDVHSVLFATRSFFTGVDFQGEACSLVVIDKLVFDVPTDPIFAARCEAVERAGGKSFFDYSIPKMALTLKQGHGRLIRSISDRGIVAILDPRVETKGYGKTVLSSLPDSPVINTLAEVHAFFDSTR